MIIYMVSFLAPGLYLFFHILFFGLGTTMFDPTSAPSRTKISHAIVQYLTVHEKGADKELPPSVTSLLVQPGERGRVHSASFYSLYPVSVCVCGTTRTATNYYCCCSTFTRPQKVAKNTQTAIRDCFMTSSNIDMFNQVGIAQGVSHHYYSRF